MSPAPEDARDGEDGELEAAEEAEAIESQDRAAADQAMRARGRQVGGVPGAMMAGLMVALRDIYEMPPRDRGSVVVDSPSEPHDADRDGMQFAATDIDGAADVTIAPLERRPPVTARRRSRLRRWTHRA